MEQDFTNREIQSMFQEVKDILHRIETQVTKTNGRVTVLELWKEGIMGKIIGASAILSFVWGYILKHFL